MTTPDSTPVFDPTPHRRVMKYFHDLTPADGNCLMSLESRRFEVGPSVNLLTLARQRQAVYFLVDGWALSFSQLRDGSRQVLECHVPGDVIGLRSANIHARENSTEPWGHAVVSEMPLTDLVGLLGREGMLPVALSWYLAREYSILAERLVNIGRRGALERTAHFFLELGERLTQAGIDARYDFHCPLSQSVLSDALGLSTIHLNRTLRELRERGLMTFRKGRVHIAAPNALVDLSGFDTDYLRPTPESIEGHLPRPQRQISNASPESWADGAGFVSNSRSTQ